LRFDVVKVSDADGDRIFADYAHGLNAVATGDKHVSAIALNDSRRGLQPEQPDRFYELAHLLGIGRPGVIGKVDLIELYQGGSRRSARAVGHGYHGVIPFSGQSAASWRRLVE
jgi:hypothetical protein